MLKKIILISIILGIVLMPYSPNLTKNNHVTHAATIASLSIPHDTTWTLANSPYIIGSDYGGGESLWILSGAALTIEPGVVVKMNEDASYQGGRRINRQWRSR